MSPCSLIAFGLVMMSGFATTARTQGLDLVLPTDNDALFHGGGPAFYQHIERDYKGVISTPWEGGQYGFVRDPMQTGAGIVYTRFHEGMDIRPVRRDARGEPLDQVRAIAPGKVVHTNLVPGHSNYGKYIVIEHDWDGSPYYSLYGHLSAITVHQGDRVERAQPIGMMGHTGRGINQARAHVHLELNLMLSRRFEAWYNAFYPRDPNYNGIYNGINLAGLDIARLYLALHQDPSLTIPKFLRSEEVFYTIAIPRSHYFELPRLYPWMVTKPPGAGARSWEVSFARSGLPLRIEASERQITAPVLIDVKQSAVDCRYLTRGDVAGRGKRAHLTESGKRLARLLIYPD